MSDVNRRDALKMMAAAGATATGAAAATTEAGCRIEAPNDKTRRAEGQPMTSSADVIQGGPLYADAPNRMSDRHADAER